MGIFGQGGAEAVTAAVDTPTPRVLETSREEAEEARQESFGKMEGEQEATRMKEKEDAFESAMEEEEEQILARRSEEKEIAFSKLIAEQEKSRKTPDLEDGGEEEEERGEGENLDSKSVIEEKVGEMADV